MGSVPLSGAAVGSTGTGVVGVANRLVQMQVQMQQQQQQQQLLLQARGVPLNTIRAPGGNVAVMMMNRFPAPAGGQGQADAEDDNADDEENMGVAETYSDYMPTKLKLGRKHPDPVVETASLASVPPPDVWYRIAIPEDTINR